jgi:hypothetical protein
LSYPVSARKTSKETALSYKTTLKAYDLLIRVLVEHLAENDDPLKGELEADESYLERDETKLGSLGCRESPGLRDPGTQ